MAVDKKAKEKKQEEAKAGLERVYTIPLRRDIIKKPVYQRSNKAVRLIKEFMVKHMKSDKILIDHKVNELVWARGAKNPPGKVKVKAVKDSDGKVRVLLEATK